MVTSQNRAYVKQAMAAFLILLITPMAAFVVSKFLSLSWINLADELPSFPEAHP